jgi:hypothetical protein
MKQSIRTYVRPELEDRLKVLAHQYDVSVSALSEELLEKGLDLKTDERLQVGTEVPAKVLEEMLYLLHLQLQILPLLGPDLSERGFAHLKEQSRQWSSNRLQALFAEVAQ